MEHPNPIDTNPPTQRLLCCAFCVHADVPPDANESGELDYIMMINGQSVCIRHASYVQGGDFSAILFIVLRNEKNALDAYNHRITKLKNKEEREGRE